MPFRILGGFKGTLFVLFRSWDLIVHFLSCINYLLLNPKNSKLYPLKYISRMTIHKLVSKFCRTTALSSHKSWDISTIFKGVFKVFKSMAFSCKFWGISFIWSSINLFMGTLKSVCSSWFALISRDKYEHTHLRVPILDFEGFGSYIKRFGDKEISWVIISQGYFRGGADPKSILVVFTLFWRFFEWSGNIWFNYSNYIVLTIFALSSHRSRVVLTVF